VDNFFGPFCGPFLPDRGIANTYRQEPIPSSSAYMMPAPIEGNDHDHWHCPSGFETMVVPILPLSSPPRWMTAVNGLLGLGPPSPASSEHGHVHRTSSAGTSLEVEGVSPSEQPHHSTVLAHSSSTTSTVAGLRLVGSTSPPAADTDTDADGSLTQMTGYRQDAEAAEGEEPSPLDGNTQPAATASKHMGGKSSKKCIKVGGFCVWACVFTAIVYKSAEGIHNYNNKNKEVMSSEAVAVVQEDIPGFEFVGYGWCKDEAGKFYDWAGYLLPSAPPSAKECAEICTECPGKGQADGRKLLGFATIKSVSDETCFCFIENGVTLDDGVCSYVNLYSRLYNAYEGTGEIKGVVFDGFDPDGECWKVTSTSSKSPKRGKSAKQPKRV
jgi:hypothetical protein